MHDHRPPSRLGRRLAILGGTTALVAAGWATTAAASSAPPADTTSAASTRRRRTRRPPRRSPSTSRSPTPGSKAFPPTSPPDSSTSRSTTRPKAPAARSTSPASSPAPTPRSSPPTSPWSSRGKPFPAYFLDVKGIVGQGMTVLQEGSYFAVIDLASNLDREATADDIKVTPLTVGPGNDDTDDPANRRRDPRRRLPVRRRRGRRRLDGDVHQHQRQPVSLRATRRLRHQRPAAVEAAAADAAHQRPELAATRRHRHVADELRLWRIRRNGSWEQRNVRRDVRIGAHVRRDVLRLRRRGRPAARHLSTTCTRCSRSPEAPRASPPAPVWCRRRCTASW